MSAGAERAESSPDEEGRRRNERAPGLDLGRLRAYLDESGPPALKVDGELAAELIAGGRSNLTYLVTDASHRWVVRRPPLGHVLATAHDMGREYRVMSALAHSPVPVPGTHVLCEDPDVLGAPFYVMDHVDGTAHRRADDLAGLDAPARERLARNLVTVLTQLHALAPAEAGLADFGRPDGFLARQVGRWGKQYAGSRSRDVPGIEELPARLAARVPTTQRATIVHGDYKLDNVVAAGEQVAAVLDWEMSTLGDPLADLGLLFVYRRSDAERHGDDSALAQLAEPETMVAWYGDRSSLALDDLPWYVALGYFKLAVIMEGIYYRYAAGLTVGDGFDRVGEGVAPLVARGLEALAGNI